MVCVKEVTDNVSQDGASKSTSSLQQDHQESQSTILTSDRRKRGRESLIDKTAKQISLAIPQKVVARADRVIK